MTPEEQYMKLMSERSSFLPEDGVDMSQDEMSAPRPDNTQMAQAAPPPSQTAGKLSAAGDTTAAAGMAGGNPYVAGAGLALKTVGMVDDAHRQGEQSKIDAYNKKIMAQRSAIRNFFA